MTYPNNHRPLNTALDWWQGVRNLLNNGFDTIRIGHVTSEDMSLTALALQVIKSLLNRLRNPASP